MIEVYYLSNTSSGRTAMKWCTCTVLNRIIRRTMAIQIIICQKLENRLKDN